MNNLIVFKLFLLYNFITKSKNLVSKICQMADVGRFCTQCLFARVLYKYYSISKCTICENTVENTLPSVMNYF